MAHDADPPTHTPESTAGAGHSDPMQEAESPMNQVASSASEAARGPELPSMADTVSAMRRVLARRFGIENPDLSPDSELAALGLDSLAFIEYAFELESELHTTLPDMPRDLVTVGDLARFIHGVVAGKSPGNVPK
jgi:acyl carrier protein